MSGYGGTVYATTDDLGSWVDTVPSGADGLLRDASIQVALACQRDPYSDTPGPSEAGPLRDATCAQAASWITLGITPAAAGLDSAPVKQSKLLSGDVSYDTSGQAQARQQAATGLAPRAEAILQTAGLLWTPTPQFDTSGALPTFGIDVYRRWPNIEADELPVCWP